MSLKRICVFCGSSDGARPVYVAAARELGAAMAARGIGLVYGGARVGLMGAIADAVLAGGGEAVGVIPQALVSREVAHTGLTALHVVESMHERKAMMASLSDAFVALPGGCGTLEELFEVLTWAQLGLHDKPCALYDVAGYYRPLLLHLDHAMTEAFLRPEHRAMVLSATTTDELWRALDGYVPPSVPKWIITPSET